MTVTVEFTPATPRIGEEVRFRVVATDPDARIYKAECAGTRIWGDGIQEGGCHVVCGTQVRYGPHTPPPAEPDRYERVFRHTYSNAGEYAVTFRFYSGTCGSPYASVGEGSATVRVTA